jgi:putative ABC transport system permease protein
VPTSLRLEDAFRDIRYGLRVLKRSPVFTAVAILTLALGIGTNAAIFHLIDTISLRSLPIANPDALVDIRADGTDSFGFSQGRNAHVTYPLWEQIRTHQRALTGTLAWADTRLVVGRGAGARPIDGLRVSGDFFRVLGVNPAIGRLFDASDDRPDCAATIAVVSYDYWRTALGSRESVVGSTLTIVDQPYTVVGVAAAGFTGLEVGSPFDIALPLCIAAREAKLTERRDIWWLRVMGRLAPGWTLAAADEHLRALSPGILDATMPTGYSAELLNTYRAFRFGAFPAGRGVSQLRETHGTSLSLLLGLTGIVLLITCGNLATLMLARAGAREREIAMRVAVGASRGRVVSQMVIESLLVAVAGAAVAVPVALASARALVRFLDTPLNPIGLTISADWRLLAFVGAAATLTTMLFGLVPALRVSMIDPAAATRETSRGHTVDRRRARLQRGLVAGQIALSLVLIVSALMFVSSFRNLSAVDLGFEPEGVIVAAFFDPADLDVPEDQLMASQHALTEAIRSVPGVMAAAASTHRPLSGNRSSHIFRVPDVADQAHVSRFAYVGPGYFEALKIPILAGRGFDARDQASSPPVLLVNESFVRHFLGTQPPIGARVRRIAEAGYPETTYEIVGVVKDTKNEDMRNDDCMCAAGTSEPKSPMAYVPIAQHPDPPRFAQLIVRATGPPAAVTAAITRRVEQLNPAMTMEFIELPTQIRARVAVERTVAWLAGAFGVLAIVLVVVGLYGIIAYLAVSRRTEIGVRLALGSTRAQVVGLVLRDSFWLLAVGMVIGVPLAIAATRGAETLLFGISATDLPTLATATLVLTGAAIVAGGVPAWRSALLPPMAAIRDEPASMWQTARRTVRKAIQVRTAGSAGALVQPGTLITDVTGLVQRAASFSEALQVALPMLRERVGAGSIALLERVGDEYRDADIAIPTRGVLLNRLTHYPHPLPLTAGELQAWLTWAREFRPEHTAEVERLADASVRMAVALRTRRGIVGVLLLGAPEGREQFGEAEKQVLNSAAEVFALMIENARLNDRALEQEKVRRDLALAAEVQRRLLPPQPPSLLAVTLAAFTLPARAIGGDCYDFVELPGGGIGIAVTDVAGKGVAAALLTSVVQTSLRMILDDGDVAPAHLAARMNQFLHRSTASASYATFFYAQLDADGRRLRYVNAGHNPPYLVRRTAAGMDIVELSTGGMVLGMFPDVAYDDTEIALQPGDLLVIFTDGVTEARSPSDEEFGEDRLKDLLQRAVGLPAEAVSSTLADQMRGWIAGAEQHDDVTFVVVTMTAAGATAAT